MKKIKLYIITTLALLFLGFIIIPQLSKELADYHKTEKIYESSEIVKAHPFFFGTPMQKSQRKLILKMTDGTEWTVGSHKSKYFNQLNSTSNYGKKFTFYSITKSDYSPERIEIEGEIIYDIKDGRIFIYFMLIVTLIVLYFIYDDFKKIKKKPADNNG